MSELWAQFSVNLYNVTEPNSLPPVDDEANSLQTIDGQTYLISINSGVNAILGGGGGFVAGQGQLVPTNGQGASNYGDLSVSNGPTYNDDEYLGPWTPVGTSRVVSPSYDVSQLNTVTPTNVNYGTFFPNLVLDTNEYVTGANGADQLQDYLFTLLTLGSASQTTVVPDGQVASSYIESAGNDFYAPVVLTLPPRFNPD